MNLPIFRLFASPGVQRSVAGIFSALSILMSTTIVSGQQVIPFGDVPTTTDFSETEIAARGRQTFRELAYSKWKELCFRGVLGAETKMVCRTTIEGKSDIGQVTLKLDLMERQDVPATRLLIFVPTGVFLQPGIKLTVDNGAAIQVPYTFCLVNGCVAATVADPHFVREMEAGRMLSLEAVNSNVITVIASLPLDSFASAHRGVAAQTFDQKLE